MVNLILLVFAFVCAALASVGVGHPRINLLAAAIGFYLLSLILNRT